MNLNTNRVSSIMKQLHGQGRRSLSVVIVIGDPTFEISLAHVDAVVKAGLDMVDLCMPSPAPNPFLDSPSLFASMKRGAVHYRGSLEPYFKCMHDIRQRYPNLPIEAICYQDVMNQMGINQFAATLNEIGVDAALFSADMSTMPFEIRQQMAAVFYDSQILPVQFATHPFRMSQIMELKEIANGYIVVQTKANSAGTRETVLPDNASNLQAIRESGMGLPLVLSYGIRTPEHVRTCMELGADGVMIGTAVIDAAYQLDSHEFSAFLTRLRAAACS